MINLKNIHSITDFQRNPKGILKEIKSGQSPAVLTVNGRAEFVVQDAGSYQNLLDKLQAAEDLAAIQEGLQQSLKNKVRPLEDALNEFEKKRDL